MRLEDSLTAQATAWSWWWWQNHNAIGGQPLKGQPHPSPEAWGAAVAGLAEAANVKQLAAALPEGALRSQLQTGADRSIDGIIDDWCGTRRPWPWPGPPPWAVAIAAEVTTVANSCPAGILRDELLRIAGQVLQKATATTGAGPAGS
jgi:hypothetical protein